MDRALRDAAPVLARHLSAGEALADVPYAFRFFLQPEFVRAFVEGDLRSLIAGTPYATKDAPAGGLRLYHSPELAIRARVVTPQAPPSRSITTLTRHTLVGNGGRAPFVLRRWRLSQSTPSGVFDPTLRLLPEADVLLAPGDAVAIAAGTEAYDVVASERTAVAITAAGTPIVLLGWHFNRATMRPARAEPARREWLFLRELLTFAEMIGDASLVPAIAELTEHPLPTLRWAAAKTANRIAPNAGRVALRSLMADEYPQLRDAARRLLASAEAR